MRSSRSVRVGVAGFGWMGRVHTQAYSRLTQHYPDLGLRPELAMVADELEGRADDAADQFGFAAATTDWHEIESDPTIEAVSITAPNFLHRSIGTAMVEAGKHIWIEKPVGLTADDARAVAPLPVWSNRRSGSRRVRRGLARNEPRRSALAALSDHLARRRRSRAQRPRGRAFARRPPHGV